MDEEYYVEKFKKAASQLDEKLLDEKQLKINVGVTLNSVVLKLYKMQWAGDKNNPVNSKTRIFFAVWVNDKTLKNKKLFYNIHALKLRELKGYRISSRAFAESFRHKFMRFSNDWENINLELGPLTLMEGWEYFKNENLENLIVKLAHNFLSIEHLIDESLENFQLK